MQELLESNGEITQSIYSNKSVNCGLRDKNEEMEKEFREKKEIQDKENSRLQQDIDKIERSLEEKQR